MKKTLLILSSLLIMPTGTAFAADMKPYAGIGLGLFELDPGKNKQSVFGGFGFVGLDIDEYFATELRTGIGGSQTREELGPLTEAFKVNWFVSLLAKPKIALASDFELYGLIGITSMRTSITPTASVIQTSSTQTGLSFGVGATYTINNQFKIGAEWVRYATNADAASKNTAAFQGLDVNGFTTTLAYQF